MSDRISEFFKPEKLRNTHSVFINPQNCYKQERDWTCSIACLRTLLSCFLDDVCPEEDFIDTYSLKPGPYFSKDIKALKMLDKYQVVYGCDVKVSELNDVITLMRNGYAVMLESVVNYSHWMVLLGVCPLNGLDKENCYLIFFDPYYNCIRMFRYDEFEAMWFDGNFAANGVERDFIALKV